MTVAEARYITALHDNFPSYLLEGLLLPALCIAFFILLMGLLSSVREGIIEGQAHTTSDDGTLERVLNFILIFDLNPFTYIEFLRLFKRCFSLKRKKRKDETRYVSCIAYTDSHTFGAPLEDTIKEYFKYKRAWLAILHAKIMATIHDWFLLSDKSMGIIYYIEEK